MMMCHLGGGEYEDEWHGSNNRQDHQDKGGEGEDQVKDNWHRHSEA